MRCWSATGDRTLLVITAGFRDALRIATRRARCSSRADHAAGTALRARGRGDERVGATATSSAAGRPGRAWRRLAPTPTLPACAPARSCSCMAIATGRMRSPSPPSRETWASPRSRCRIEVSPLMKLVPRGDTTVVDAYLSPILRRYVDQIAHRCPACQADVHAEFERRPDRRAALSGQGRSCPGPPAASSAWCSQRCRRVRPV
jgi:5-oxoprolinase (ATP-hydrolysing)